MWYGSALESEFMRFVRFDITYSNDEYGKYIQDAVH